MNLETCLPTRLRVPTTSITRVGAGLSGAGVYHVEAAGQSFVLKIAGENEPVAAWHRKLHIQQLAANAGLAPEIVHVDEERRAVVSAFVVDRGFPMLLMTPTTREGAIAQLGRTLRRVHDLPLSELIEAKDGRAFLQMMWSGLSDDVSIPSFVGESVSRVLAEDAPPSGRAPVLSHNDVNPTNLVYDGERLLLLDWETAGVNDPFYDLAAISVFFRMDENTCKQLLSAHDGEPVTQLPPRFVYDRRLAATMCGAAFLHLARRAGHPGGAATESLEAVPSLSDVYQRLRSGALSVASAEGQWVFGMALVKESLT
jgi:thiamine kinase-like enzyme